MMCGRGDKCLHSCDMYEPTRVDIVNDMAFCRPAQNQTHSRAENAACIYNVRCFDYTRRWAQVERHMHGDLRLTNIVHSFTLTYS